MEVRIDDADARVIAKWASISRTLSNAQEACWSTTSGTNTSAGDIYAITYDEIQILRPILHRLHMAIRQAVMEVDHGSA